MRPSSHGSNARLDVQVRPERPELPRVTVGDVINALGARKRLPASSGAGPHGESLKVKPLREKRRLTQRLFFYARLLKSFVSATLGA